MEGPSLQNGASGSLVDAPPSLRDAIILIHNYRCNMFASFATHHLGDNSHLKAQWNMVHLCIIFDSKQIVQVSKIPTSIVTTVH